ncbi:MAG: DUF3054 domain-containing protein [Actinomycetota bacterium]
MKAEATRASLRPWQLAVGDAVAVALFAPLGLLSHDEGVTLSGLARNAGPVTIGFLAAALVVGAYRRPGLGTLFPAWALGVTAGVLARAAILGHGYGAKTFTFLAVTLAVTLVLLLVWRSAAALAARRR